MSRYLIERLIFIVFLLCLIVFLNQYGFSYLWVTIPIILFVMYVAYNAFHLEQNFFLKSITQGVKGKKGIAITFDDGPNEKITPQVLAILEKHKVKATFFCIGNEVEKHPEIVKHLDAAGHTIGSHSYSHAKWIDFNTTKKWVEEIDKTNDVIHNVIGKTTRYFRPPYGVSTSHLANAIKRTKMLSIGWNIRSLDTMDNNVLEIVERSTHNLKDGCIVLFHDNFDWSCEVLEEFLVRVKKMNMEIVPLSNLIEEKAYEN